MNFLEPGDILVDSATWPLLQRAGLSDFDSFMDFPGGRRVVHKRGRSVFRFELEGRAFYLKRNRLHRWELLKQLSRGKLPPRSAHQEWRSIQAVTAAGIPTVKPVAFGESTCLGMETASFTVTEELYGARPLDELIRDGYLDRLVAQERRALISKLAALARKLHDAGMNHQDFYLNHFFIGEDESVYLLDLQRVQLRQRVPERYLIKDLAQLNYSVDYYGGFSRSDKMRFLKGYTGSEKFTEKDKTLIAKVLVKTARIARHDVKLMARRRQRGELPSL